MKPKAKAKPKAQAALVLDPRNAKKHSDRNRKQIRQSLESVGPFRSIGAVRGVVKVGNGVYTEAQALGLKVKRVKADRDTLIVVDRDDLTDAEADRAAMLDNLAADSSAFDYEAQRFAELVNGDALLTQMAQEEKRYAELMQAANPAQAEPVDAATLIDKAQELQKKWQVARGDVWVCGRHRLMCGDSTSAEDVQRLMGGDKAKAVVTSPPYPGADMWDNVGTVKQVEEIGLNALRLVVRFLDDGCPILWNIANTPIGTKAGVVHTTTTTTTKVAADELGLLCYGEIVWSKPVQHLTPLAFMMRPCVPNLIHEYVMIFYKGKRKQREGKSGLSDDAKSYRTSSVWEISPESAKAIGHKAPFPVELAKRCIELWSLENDIVLDPFVGSGSTIIACEQNNRAGRGMEIEPPSMAISLERLSNLGLKCERVTDAPSGDGIHGKGKRRKGR